MREQDDRDVRMSIMRKFYAAYRQHGLAALLVAWEVAQELGLGAAQARRCFDYLRAKGLIRPMTVGGGYSPTVTLVDEIEALETSAHEKQTK